MGAIGTACSAPQAEASPARDTPITDIPITETPVTDSTSRAEGSSAEDAAPLVPQVQTLLQRQSLGGIQRIFFFCLLSLWEFNV